MVYVYKYRPNGHEEARLQGSMCNNDRKYLAQFIGFIEDAVLYKGLLC